MSTFSSSFRLEASQLMHQGALFQLQLCDFSSDYDPLIHNCCKIAVDLSSDVNLDFSLAEKNAAKIISAGGFILWDVFIDFPDKLSQMKFEGLFNVHYHSLKVFTQALLEPFKDHTLGCLIYQGSAEVDRVFSMSSLDVLEFQEWLEDTFSTPARLFETTENALGDITTFSDIDQHMLEITPFSRHLRNLYTMNVFSGYLHRLAAALPDELLVFVALECRSDAHEAFTAQLFSKERFSHLNLLTQDNASLFESVALTHDNQHPPVVGVCFPNDPQCLLSTLNAFKQLLVDLKQRNIFFKIIPEFMMTASWDGLDYMIYMKKSLSSQGKRMLQGFVAAGGICVHTDESLGLEEEKSLTEFYKEV